MNSLSTRFFCAVMSMVGAAGLVAFASPAIAVGGDTAAKAPAIVAATAPASFAHNG